MRRDTRIVMFDRWDVRNVNTGHMMVLLPYLMCSGLLDGGHQTRHATTF